MSRHIEKRTEPPDDTLKRVEARVAGRKAATEVFPLLEWPDSNGREFAQSFVETMSALCQIDSEYSESEKPPEPLARLGATEMPFGQHQGKSFDDTPLEYLDWLCRSQEDFYKSLRAYLRHPDLESRRRGIGD